MYTEIILPILFKMLSKVSTKLTRKIYPKKIFKEDIEIDVRSTNPISFCLNSRIPTVEIYLKITNMSRYLDITIEHITFSVWLRHDKGFQPIIKQNNVSLKEVIRQGKYKVIYRSIELKDSQINYLREIKESKEVLSTLYLKIHINSSLYQIKKEVNLENKPCKIEG